MSQLRDMAARMKARGEQTMNEMQDAIDGRREPTPEEWRRWGETIDQLAEHTERRDREVDAELSRKVRELGAGIGAPDSSSGTSSHPRVRAAGGDGGWGRAVLDASSDKGGGFARFKQLVSPGSVTVTVPLTTEPVRTNEPVLVLRQLLTSQPDTTGRWAYLRQNLRENAATVVAPGTRKPTSRYQVERIENRSRVLAHLSESIARQDLDDAPALRQFVDTELRLGVETALENEIINGDATGEHFEGIAHTSGIQVQPYDTDHVRTLRRALTLLESLSLNGTGYVMSPADWETVELAANAYGYTMAQAGQQVPVDRAARRLWGVPVVTSTTVATGTAYLLDTSSLALRIREDMRVDWSENVYDPDRFGPGAGGSLFEANMIQFRAEMRAGLDVTRPAGCVEVDLTAV